MSTRKVKPSSVISASAAISFLPRRMKNSWFDSALARPSGGVAVFRVDEDQVDVGRDVQLAAALLAHRQHHQLLRRPDSRPIGVPWAAPSPHQLGQVGWMAKSAKRVMASTTSARSALPSRSRWIRPQTSRLRSGAWRAPAARRRAVRHRLRFFC
jgi:hypothetical protein